MLFSIFDWIVIGALVLGILLGALRGFSKLILNGLMSTLMSIVVAALLAIYIAIPIYDSSLGTTIHDSLVNKINSSSEVFTYVLVEDSYNEAALQDPDNTDNIVRIEDAISENTPIPAFAAGFVSKLITNNIASETLNSDLTLSDIIGDITTIWILRISLAIIGFIVGLIFFHILRKINEKLEDYKWFKATDRILGVVVRAGIVCAAVYAVLILSNSVSFFKTIADESGILHLFMK